MKKVIILMLLVMPVSIMAQKFGHFNSSEVIQLMPEYTSAQAEIQKLQSTYEADLKSMQEELERKATAYDSAKDSLPENIRTRRETELNELYQRIQTTYSDNQQELQKVSNERMQTISERLLTAVKSIGDAEGYVYIMDTTAGVAYINTSISVDVTAQIKQKLGL